jgi:hypothetical protein
MARALYPRRSPAAPGPFFDFLRSRLQPFPRLQNPNHDPFPDISYLVSGDTLTKEIIREVRWSATLYFSPLSLWKVMAYSGMPDKARLALSLVALVTLGFAYSFGADS